MFCDCKGIAEEERIGLKFTKMNELPHTCTREHSVAAAVWSLYSRTQGNFAPEAHYSSWVISMTGCAAEDTS